MSDKTTTYTIEIDGKEQKYTAFTNYSALLMAVNDNPNASSIVIKERK